MGDKENRIVKERCYNGEDKNIDGEKTRNSRNCIRCCIPRMRWLCKNAQKTRCNNISIIIAEIDYF